jgi:hypothetical protein
VRGSCFGLHRGGFTHTVYGVLSRRLSRTKPEDGGEREGDERDDESLRGMCRVALQRTTVTDGEPRVEINGCHDEPRWTTPRRKGSRRFP